MTLHQNTSLQKAAGDRNVMVCTKKIFSLNHVLLGHMARLLQIASDSSLELKTGFFPGCSGTCPQM